MIRAYTTLPYVIIERSDDIVDCKLYTDTVVSIFLKSFFYRYPVNTRTCVHLTAIVSNETFSNRSRAIDEMTSVYDGTRSYYSVSRRGSALGKVLRMRRSNGIEMKHRRSTYSRMTTVYGGQVDGDNGVRHISDITLRRNEFEKSACTTDVCTVFYTFFYSPTTRRM